MSLFLSNLRSRIGLDPCLIGLGYLWGIRLSSRLRLLCVLVIMGHEIGEGYLILCSYCMCDCFGSFMVMVLFMEGAIFYLF